MNDATAVAEARRRGALSALLLAHGGAGHDARRTAADAVIGTRLVHLCRDTPWGMTLRSHFFLGHDLPAAGMPKEVMMKTFRDIIGPNLLQHCYDEFSMLSRFLPGIYDAEGNISATRHW